jgi:hypothetical protein
MRMTKIEQIWSELEKDTSVSNGLIYRRYDGTVFPNVFIALKVPEQFRCISASLNSGIVINLNSLSNLKDIAIELIPETTGRNTILIKLINKKHQDIFSTLSADLISSVATINDENQLAKILVDRFEKWKSMFDKASQSGLSGEEQRGLFGELFLLRKFIQRSANKLSAVQLWVGCAGEVKDFQSGNWAIEVKTTHGNNHQKIHVSSERQLDTSNLQSLYLFHLSLDVRHGSGETLNQIVDDISSLLSEDFIAYNRFKSKLIEGGYFDAHRSLYSDSGYFIRADSFYTVHQDFPRIEESDIRAGVGDVSYSLILSRCADYLTTEEAVFLNTHIS